MVSVIQIKGYLMHMKSIRILIVTIVLGVLTEASFASENSNHAPLIIDTRTEAEWNEGHLEGAVLIPYDRIAQGITAFAPEKTPKSISTVAPGAVQVLHSKPLKKLAIVI
jgi:phage shock protein E